MIIYRLYFENVGLTEKWWNDFSSLTDEEKMVINPIIEKNDFNLFTSSADAVDSFLSSFEISITRHPNV